MSNEKDGQKDSGEWVMPAPIFRTTEGRTPARDETADIPTEPGFREDETVEIAEPEQPATPVPAPQSVREKPREFEVSKKGGCASSFFAMVTVIIAIAIAVVLGIVYFLFYYRGSDTTF